MSSYDPKIYWDEKAKKAAGNAGIAACGQNPHENACIEKAQLRALSRALKIISQHTTLDGKALLDYGCGSGRWVEYFNKLNVNYYGVDISSEMIALSTTLYPEKDFRTLQEKQIPLDTNSCDFIFSIAVIHHNQKPQQLEILSELNRVLKPGGFLFLFEGVGSEQRQREFPNPMPDWINMVEGLGFQCLMSKGYGYYLLTDFMNNTARKFRIPKIYNWRPGLLLALDRVVSPRVTPMLPPVFHDRAAMLFRKHSV